MKRHGRRKTNSAVTLNLLNVRPGAKASRFETNSIFSQKDSEQRSNINPASNRHKKLLPNKQLLRSNQEYNYKLFARLGRLNLSSNFDVVSAKIPRIFATNPVGLAKFR